MSILKVNKIEHTGTTDGGIEIDSDGHVQIDSIQLPTAGPLSNRNLIINGSMQVAQRGTSSTTGGFGSCDRWSCQFSGGAQTHSQETADPDTTADDSTIWDNGFRNFLRLTNTTAASGAGAFRAYVYFIEAQDLANSGWDYENSNSFITLSFYFRSSVSQEYYAYITSEDGTRQRYLFSLGTPTANTWTRYTTTIPGGANVQFNNDIGRGFTLVIAPFWGTDFTSSSAVLDQWANVDDSVRAPDYTTTWGATAGATFDLTGVQLEVGELATPFEHRRFGDELSRCQRYYVRTGGSRLFAAGGNTTTVTAPIFLPVEMRNTPDVEDINMVTVRRYDATSAGNVGSATVAVSAVFDTVYMVNIGNLTSVSDNQNYHINGSWNFSAEL